MERMLLQLMHRILQSPARLKILFKLRRFKCNCIGCQNLSVGPAANVFKEGTGVLEIGKNCDIHAVLSVKNGARLRIGDYTTIRGNSVIGAVEKVQIGNCCIISNNVHIYDNNNHPVNPVIRHQMCINGFYGDSWNWDKSEHSAIVIEDDVWIGERSTILKGVTVGKGSIVASNSVVTKNVPPMSIVAGNPARVVKHLENDNQ